MRPDPAPAQILLRRVAANPVTGRGNVFEGFLFSFLVLAVPRKILSTESVVDFDCLSRSILIKVSS